MSTVRICQLKTLHFLSIYSGKQRLWTFFIPKIMKTAFLVDGGFLSEDTDLSKALSLLIAQRRLPKTLFPIVLDTSIE